MGILKGFSNEGRVKRKWAVVYASVIVFLLAGVCYGDIGQNEVLILVNGDSPTSKYIARMYREYYPDIAEDQVLELFNLADCSGTEADAASEIITRSQYNDNIAGPVRDYLTNKGWETQIKVIITTAGIPYRIEDTYFSDVVSPAGSNPWTVSGNLGLIDAASVESELTCLCVSDYGTNPFGLSNRMVNVYQGYRGSSISEFERVAPETKDMEWSAAWPGGSYPKMEGETYWGFPPVYGTFNRLFNAGDIYLVCRLDGPKGQGSSAIFAVRAMLERSKLASDPASGVSPAQAVVLLDEDEHPEYGNLDNNRIYNLDSSVNYIVYQDGTNQPPDARTKLIRSDYCETFVALTNQQSSSDQLNISYADCGQEFLVMYDNRIGVCPTQSDIDAYAAGDANRAELQGVIALASYGCNGSAGLGNDYIFGCGPSGGALCNVVNGAVFTSIESYNALTMFSDCSTSQGKIIDFICIGGTGAIGHAFEPEGSAVVDNMYFVYNLLADADDDGFADMTFVEAAWTGIPFLSWSEVVIGDPLMRVAYGPGSNFVWTYFPGDVNNDNVVDYRDIYEMKSHYRGRLDLTSSTYFDLYDDMCDVNQDGVVDYRDIYETKLNYRNRR